MAVMFRNFLDLLAEPLYETARQDPSTKPSQEDDNGGTSPRVRRYPIAIDRGIGSGVDGEECEWNRKDQE